MVGLTTTLQIDYEGRYSNALSKASSVDALYCDPDLLIREYFLSPLEQRAVSRKTIISHIKTWQSVLVIVSWGASGKAQDSYDGAINLLAETKNFRLLEFATSGAATYIGMLNKGLHVNFAENCLEIIIKSIACAYQVDAKQRFALLSNFIHLTDRRVIKATIIDALMIISDEIDVTTIRDVINVFTTDQDEYIRDYAEEALQGIE